MTQHRSFYFNELPESDRSQPLISQDQQPPTTTKLAHFFNSSNYFQKTSRSNFAREAAGQGRSDYSAKSAARGLNDSLALGSPLATALEKFFTRFQKFEMSSSRSNYRITTSINTMGVFNFLAPSVIVRMTGRNMDGRVAGIPLKVAAIEYTASDPADGAGLKKKISIKELLLWRLAQAKAKAPPAPRAKRLLELAQPGGNKLHRNISNLP